MGRSNGEINLTQNKLLRARRGCRAQWFAIGRRSVGAWSAWCRVSAALHLAYSSMEKVCAVWSARIFKEPTFTQTFNPLRLTYWSAWRQCPLGGRIILPHPHWIFSILLLYIPSHCNATQVDRSAKWLEIPAVKWKCPSHQCAHLSVLTHHLKLRQTFSNKPTAFFMPKFFKLWVRLKML